jgi:hypothetical protein
VNVLRLEKSVTGGEDFGAVCRSTQGLLIRDNVINGKLLTTQEKIDE